MDVTEPADVHAPVEACPQCGAHLLVLRGDGFIDTTCSRCGYAVRQHPARRVKHEPYEVGPLIAPSMHPFSDAIRERPPVRRPTHKAWLLGWGGAVGAMLACVIGVSEYLPIYLAALYLTAFGVALALHRILRAYAGGQRWPDGVVWHMVIFVSAYVAGTWLGQVAPDIGEPNYCPSTTAAMLLRPVPHTFRCTSLPAWFGGFVAAYWVLGWIAIRIQERRDG